MNKLFFLFLTLTSALLTACSSGEKPVPEKVESLIDFKDGVYVEYYPGRKAIKYKGGKDANNQRDGIWYFYAENGVEQSMTEYKHGMRDGGSFARYPNGAMRYYGEYKNDQPSGKWVLYKEDGTISTEKDYGTPEEKK